MKQNLYSSIQFHKLDLKDTNYTINHKRKYAPSGIFAPDQISDCLKFAFSMTFGEEGEHRPYRSGGKINRTPIEIFKDAFHGKLAEFGFYNRYNLKHPNNPISRPDLQCWKSGKWDFTDFELHINDKDYNIAIKSTKFYSNLLLLETRDWDSNGIYNPNSIKYDFIFLIRLDSKLDYDKILKYENDAIIINKDYINTINSGLTPYIYYDIPGYITYNDLIDIINQKQIIKQDYTLNHNTIIDADNYYCQAGDLRYWSPVAKQNE